MAALINIEPIESNLSRLSGAAVNQCDDMVRQLQQAEQTTKEFVDQILATNANAIQNVQHEELNRQVVQRDRLRANCIQMLDQLCQHLDTLTSTQQSQSIRLQSIKSLLSSVQDHKEELTREQMEHASKVDTKAYDRFLSDAENNLGSFVQRTNQAYDTFKRALEEEVNAMQSYLTTHCSDINILREGILQRGRELVEQKTPNEQQQDEESKRMHLEELRSHYSFLRHNIFHMIQRKNELNENWHQSNEETESQLRGARRNLLKLKYQREELEIDGANGNFIAGDRKSVV